MSVIEVRVKKVVQVRGRGTCFVTDDDAEIGDYFLGGPNNEPAHWYCVVGIEAFRDPLTSKIRKPIGLIVRQIPDEELTMRCLSCDSPIPSDIENGIFFCDSACRMAWEYERFHK